MLIEYNTLMSILMGVFCGVSVAFGLVAILVEKSNNHGEEDENLEKYSQYPMFISESKDNLNKPYYKI